jgi:hypothetical protein
LVAACRKVSRRATVARRRRHIFRNLRTQGNDGPWKKLGAAGKMVTLRAKLARHKGKVVRKDLTRNQVERETQKRLKNETRLWKYPKGINGIVNEACDNSYWAAGE